MMSLLVIDQYLHYFLYMCVKKCQNTYIKKDHIDQIISFKDFNFWPITGQQIEKKINVFANNTCKMYAYVKTLNNSKF